MRDIKEVERELNEVGNLPTISVVASKLLDLLTDENVSMNKISQLMKLDPAITSKILKIVNSAYYGLRKEIDTLRMALVILGINEITNIIMGLSIFKGFSGSESDSDFDREKFWEHSAVTAYIASYLCKELKITVHGEEFTAGLIHDIGKIIMDQYYTEEFSMVNRMVTEHNVFSFSAEKNMLGVTHEQVGAFIAQKWKFPQKMINSILYHHHSTKAEEDQEFISIISLSDLLAHKFDDYLAEVYERVNVEKTAVWKFIESKHPNISFEKISNEVQEEVKKAKEFISTALV